MLIRVMELQLGVNPEWWATGEGEMFLENPKEGDDIPVLTEIPAGEWRFWIDSQPAGAAEEYISVPGLRGENLFAIRVKGDSMEPQIHAGDILVLDPRRSFDGGLAVVRHRDGYKVRNVRHIAPDRWLLVPLNPAYNTEEIAPDEQTWFYVPVKLISIRDIGSI